MAPVYFVCGSALADLGRHFLGNSAHEKWRTRWGVQDDALGNFFLPDWLALSPASPEVASRLMFDDVWPPQVPFTLTGTTLCSNVVIALLPLMCSLGQLELKGLSSRENVSPGYFNFGIQKSRIKKLFN